MVYNLSYSSSSNNAQGGITGSLVPHTRNQWPMESFNAGLGNPKLNHPSGRFGADVRHHGSCWSGDLTSDAVRTVATADG